MNNSNENKIRLLPDFIANQIAAGEVVQRPESVVKELVENSLDAGADAVIISVRNAGKSIIHIIDNGSGMTRDDVELSIKRHATSKVFTSDDLEEIKTFGFRGEALASVCSVSNVEIRTKQKNESYGWKLISEPLKDIIIEPDNCDNGTQIFVRNLFYNVPARRKFLKSNLTEFRYISDTVIKIALSKPDVRFTFYDEDTLIFDVHPSSLKERIVNLLGQSVNQSLIECDYQNEFIKITGYIGEPHLARQSRSGQYFFLNGRPISSNSLFHSVSSCYEELLDKNHKPVFILNLEIDYSKVDVNVHPQKHEVKFDDERFVYNSIKSAVMNALSSVNLLADTNVNLINSANPFTKINDGESDIFVNKLTGEVFGQNPARENFGTGSPNIKIDNSNNFRNSAFDDIFGKFPVTPQVQLELPDNSDDLRFNYLMNRFVIFEFDNYMIIIDQSGLSQRIIYDKTKNYLQGKKNEFSLQELLFPLTIELKSDNVVKIKKLQNEIEKIGFKIEFGQNSIMFYTIPDLIRQGNEEDTLKKFVEDIIFDDFANSQSIIDKICTSFSEAGGIANGMRLSDIEIRNMIKNLRNYKIPVFSPKGKKSVIRVTSQEFYNKLFFSS
jgi:DNA mismatch repair protein MutL